VPGKRTWLIVPFNWIHAIGCTPGAMANISGWRIRARHAVPLLENQQHQGFEQSNLIVHHPIEKREEQQ
jgi:hypothetical protein